MTVSFILVKQLAQKLLVYFIPTKERNQHHAVHPICNSADVNSYYITEYQNKTGHHDAFNFASYDFTFCIDSDRIFTMRIV